MLLPIIGAIALTAAIAMLGGIGIALLILAAMAWLLVAYRPVDAGAMVSGLARQRFE